jgi:hypothetical protein
MSGKKFDINSQHTEISDRIVDGLKRGISRRDVMRTLVYFKSIVWHTFPAWGMSRNIFRQAYLQHAARFNRIASVLVGGFGLRLIVTTMQELRG